MNKTPVAQYAKTVSFLPPTQGILQRKCACGPHTMAGGECAGCAKNTNSLQRKLAIGASHDPLEQEADRVADQVMATPPHSAVSGAPPRIQRSTGHATEESSLAPASVDRVLASRGRPLDPALQQDMGQRFGHDFSRVRVHFDAAAEQSARDVHAHAYTVGHDIVFGAGQFATGRNEGRRLIAHELTHVVQQERGLLAGSLQRQEGRPRPAPVDADAQRIIDLAQDTSTPIDQRAIAVVQAIICLGSELRSANTIRRDELVTRRVEAVRRSGRDDLGEAPTTCRRPPGDRGPGSTRSGGLSGGAIAGIVLGAVAGAAAIGLGIAALAGAF